MKFKIIKNLLEVSSQDPQDARRRKLLNILLIGIYTISLVALVILLFIFIVAPSFKGTLFRLWPAITAFLLGLTIIYLINRYGAEWIAATIFLLLLITVFAFVDEPRQVVEGRALFLFTVPILISSVILRPWVSFIAAGICGLVITILAVFNLPDYAQGVPPIPTIVGFFTVAFVSWLSARSLEDALVDLHTINRELDQRVELRTHELKEANQELANAYEQLKELDRLKSMFVSIISHELRTPLSAIQGFAEMLIAEVFGAVSQEQIGALERIIANDKHLLNLVNDLLDEARLSAGQLSLHVEPFAPKALLGDMYVTMSVLAEQQELSLTTELDPLLPETLQGDQKRLHQILVNLVNNAIKFTEKGGIHVRIYQTDAISWAMNVTDTGPGIAEEAQKYIFEPFRQVENPETRKHKGFGLGLSIVNQLVTLMDGKIILTSQLGEGTTFSIRLPLMLPEPALPKE